MSAMEVPLTVAQHRVVRDALHVVDEQALKVARRVRPGPHGRRGERSARHRQDRPLRDHARRYDEARGDTFAYFASLRVRGPCSAASRSRAHGPRRALHGERGRPAHGRLRRRLRRPPTRRAEIEAPRRPLRRERRRRDVRRGRPRRRGAKANLDADPISGREERARRTILSRSASSGARSRTSDEGALLDILFDHGFDLHAAADQLGVDRQTAWRRLQRLLARACAAISARFIREAPCPRNDVPIPQAPGLRLVLSSARPTMDRTTTTIRSDGRPSMRGYTCFALRARAPEPGPEDTARVVITDPRSAATFSGPPSSSGPRNPDQAEWAPPKPRGSSCPMGCR